MTARKIVTPSISIGGTEFKCMSREVTLEPGDAINFCEDQWTFSVEIELGFGAGSSYEALRAMALTEQTVIVKPSDAAVSIDNPSATFQALVPKIPFLSGATRGERMTFSLEMMSEGDPVIATS